MPDWTQTMFIWSAAGAIAGIFYPTLVKLYQGVSAGNVDIITSWAAGSRVTVTKGTAAKMLAAYVVLGTIIGLVIAALGFAALLGNASSQASLRELGILAYFTAFTAGFTGASVIEEPMKKNG